MASLSMISMPAGIIPAPMVSATACPAASGVGNSASMAVRASGVGSSPVNT